MRQSVDRGLGWQDTSSVVVLVILFKHTLQNSYLLWRQRFGFVFSLLWPNAQKKELQKRRFNLALLVCCGRHGGRNTRLVILHPQSGSRKHWMKMLSFYFFFSGKDPGPWNSVTHICSRSSQLNERVLPIFMVGLPNSTDPTWKLPHKCAPKFVSMVILNLM